MSGCVRVEASIACSILIPTTEPCSQAREREEKLWTGNKATLFGYLVSNLCPKVLLLAVWKAEGKQA